VQNLAEEMEEEIQQDSASANTLEVDVRIKHGTLVA